MSNYYRRLNNRVNLFSIDGLKDVYVPNNSHTAAFYRWLIDNIRDLWATLANVDAANTGYFSIRSATANGTTANAQADVPLNLISLLDKTDTLDVSNGPTAGNLVVRDSLTHPGEYKLIAMNAPLKSWYTLRADIEVVPAEEGGVVNDLYVTSRWGDTNTDGLTYEDQFNDYTLHPINYNRTEEGGLRFTVDVPNVVVEGEGVVNRVNKIGLELTASDDCVVKIHRVDLYVHA